MWDTNFRLGTYDTRGDAELDAGRGETVAQRAGITELHFDTAHSPGRGWIAYVTGSNADVESFKKIWS